LRAWPDIGTVSGMARPPQHRAPKQRLAAPANLRPRLERARLDLRALFRALDRMLLAQDLPAELRRLQELDADFGEALWVLDQPPGKFDLAAMARDTLASLDRVPAAREAFLAVFDAPTRAQLGARVQATRSMLSPEDAYLDIPGRHPAAQ
jgi:hypothetical protein